MKQFVGGFILAALVSIAAVPFAQSNIPREPASGTLDDGDKLLIKFVALQAQLAQCQSEQLDSMKQFTSTRAEVLKRIEAKHPGFTLDMNTGQLVPKTK